MPADDTDLIRQALADAIDHRRSRAAMCGGDCMCRGYRCDECFEDQQLAEDYEELLDLLDSQAYEHEDGPPPRPEQDVPVRGGLL